MDSETCKEYKFLDDIDFYRDVLPEMLEPDIFQGRVIERLTSKPYKSMNITIPDTCASIDGKISVDNLIDYLDSLNSPQNMGGISNIIMIPFTDSHKRKYKGVVFRLISILSNEGNCDFILKASGQYIIKESIWSKLMKVIKSPLGWI